MKTVWTVTTCDTGDDVEPTIDVCEKLETAKQLALELLDVDGWFDQEDEGDAELLTILDAGAAAVEAFDGGGGFLEVGYFDGNMGKLRIQAAVLR